MYSFIGKYYSMNNLLSHTSLYQLIYGRHGYFLCNPNDIYIGRALLKYGEFSECESFVIRQLCPQNAIVIEIGANIGAHTVMMAKAVGKNGRILAFEPQRIIFQNLCANIALNNLFNVDTYNIALGDQQGQVLIPDIDYTKKSNYGAISADQFNTGRPVKVETLDTTFNFSHLHAIKVDAEGMELQILKGAAKTIARYKPILYVENDRREKHFDLINYINEAEYDMFWHTPPLFNSNNFTHEKENIYKNIVSINMLCIHRSQKHDIRQLKPVDIKKPHFLDKKVKRSL